MGRVRCFKQREQSEVQALSSPVGQPASPHQIHGLRGTVPFRAVRGGMGLRASHWNVSGHGLSCSHIWP